MADSFTEPTLETKTKGSFIYLCNQPVTELSMLMSGKVSVIQGKTSFDVKPGEIIGLYDLMSDTFHHSYIAAEDCVLMALPCIKQSELEKAICDYPNIRGGFVTSMGRLCVYLFRQYSKLHREVNSLIDFIKIKQDSFQLICKDNLLPNIDFSKLSGEILTVPADDISSETSEYYSNLIKIDQDSCNVFYEKSKYISIYHFKEAYELASEISQQISALSLQYEKLMAFLIGTGHNCLFQMFCALYIELCKADKNPAGAYRNITELFSHAQSAGAEHKLLANASAMLDGIAKTVVKSPSKGDSSQKEISSEDFVNLQKLTENTLEKLLAYSDLPEERTAPLKAAIIAFRGLKDKNNTDDATTEIRKTIAKNFYPLYEAVFFKYVETGARNKLIEMFLNTCFVDEQLVSEDQLKELFSLNLEPVDDDIRIFTMYEWLLDIFRGNQEPSRNEFDQDYNAIIRERKRTEKLDDTQVMTLLKDKKAKTRFEIQNFFRSTHRITCGQILGFCPILYSDYKDEHFSSLFVSKKRIKDLFLQYRALDFSIYYRTVPYEINRFGLGKELLQKEVLPYIILNPITGQKGIMWQELAGAKKDTPARFSFPIFFRGDLGVTVLKTLGQFRWELCKNIEGPFWSDIRQKSLTSEFFDYISFYKKNHDLSNEAKEKIKNNLAKYHNNFKEMFVQDYVTYMQYESTGALRLNRISRTILFKYCPFNAATRKTLLSNPGFKDLVEYHGKQCTAKLRRINGVHNTIANNGGEIPPEFDINKQFYML